MSVGGTRRAMPDKRAKVEEYYKQGYTASEISGMVGVNVNTVHSWLHSYRERNGIKPARRQKAEPVECKRKPGERLTPAEISKIMSMIEQGIPAKEISRTVGVHIITVRRYVQQWRKGINGEVISIDEDGFNGDRHLCHICQYRAKDGSYGGRPGCNFYLITDIERGCPVAVCNRFKEGANLTKIRDKERAKAKQMSEDETQRFINKLMAERPDIANALINIGDKERRHGKKAK